MENSLVKLKQITQQAATAETSDKQMRYIVTAIREAMQVEVCSLYLSGPKDILTLVATEGLDPHSINNVTLQYGEGLVGTIAGSRHPLNIENAAEHPAYKYFPETHEEQYSAFLGVPLMHLRKPVGVLVVQELRRHKFSDEDEAFLVTIGAQLAGTLSSIDHAAENLFTHGSIQGRKLAGIKGSSGIGIGRVLWVDTEGLMHAPDREIEDIDFELHRFQVAVAQTRQELEALSVELAAALPDGVVSIFGVYTMLLDEGELVTDIESKIRGGNWAVGAVRATINDYATLFETMEDPYFQARGEDIHHIGNKLYAHLIGEKAEPIVDQQHKFILAGHLVSITDIARFKTGQLGGIICTAGSALSHTVVLANALGLPAVMGVGAIKDLGDNTLAIIDGHQGEVIFDPSDSLLVEYQALLTQEHSLQLELEELKDLEAITLDGHRIKLYANTGLAADISPGLARGAEGIGLYRSEIPFMTHENFPTEEEQFTIYRQILEAYRGKPVYMRTLDIGGDKQLPYYSFAEDNPCLGWRGIRFTLDNLPIFMTQIRAMLRASAGVDNLNILLPMVSRVDEITSFTGILNDAFTQLTTEGLKLTRPKVGVMIEVPAAISLIEFIRPHIDFISIGSNDLSQYLLAVDRNNSRVSPLLDKLHPAIIHEIQRITLLAKKLDLQLSLCGEMASDPHSVVLLVGMGIETLSLNAFNLPKIKRLIRSISRKEAEVLLFKSLRLSHEKEIRDLIDELLHQRGLAELTG